MRAQVIRVNTGIPFEPRLKTRDGKLIKDGEKIHIRDGSGKVVETWGCLKNKGGKVTFLAEGYSDTASM